MRQRIMAGPVGRVVRRLFWAFSRSPWARVDMQVPAAAFGPGSRCQFAEYLRGDSSVSVRSLDDIVEWLRGCKYASDAELFAERDLWQHPAAFETRRRGDCEDFALWAWRKLAEIGIDAEFFVGRVLGGAVGGPTRQHAWVVYRVGGVDYLFEPAASPERMIRRLADVVDEYIPHFAVNGALATSAFVGCLAGAPFGI